MNQLAGSPSLTLSSETSVRTAIPQRSDRPRAEPLDAERTDSQRSPPRTGVSVIIPTYNESRNISPVVAECLKALPPSEFDAEIIVVDDDSDDYTWQYPHRLYGHDPRVRIIRRQTDEKGLARSVTDGFEAATHEFCTVIDADLQHPPDKLPELVTALDQGAEIAIGSRHVEDGGIENWSAWRKLVSRGATTCSRVALPDARSVSDPMSGFFAVRKSVVDDVDLDPQGYKILLEILGKGEYETVYEVPYVFRERERGESKLTAEEYQRFLEHLGHLAIVSRGLDRLIEPWRAVRAGEFALVGAVGTVINMVVFTALTLGTDLFFLLIGIVSFLVALNWNFVGNWLLTYDRPKRNLGRQYVRFHFVSVAGFVVYSATLAGSVAAGVPVLVGNAIAIVAGAGFNFAGSDTTVFPTSDPSRSDESSTGERSDAATESTGRPAAMQHYSEAHDD